MDPIYPNLVLEALKQVKYPGTGKNIVTAEMVEDDMRIDGAKVTFSIIFPKAKDPFQKSLIKACEAAIKRHIGDWVEIEGNITAKLPKIEPKPTHPPLPGIKNIIAVASGKGGVGKSTVAANLAVALAKAGYKVGLLDADIHGPSMPKMFGMEDAKPLLDKVNGKDCIIPEEKYGVKVLSIGFFVDPKDALMWRGSMASNALSQLIRDGIWGELDYFVMDLPPGTGDIHLTLVQSIPITGAVVVSTPQDVALADARKGISMFQAEKINVPVLGLVENMAWFTPAELPNNKYYIFGKDGCKKLAEDLKVPLLGQIPLVQSIREQGDIGQPVACFEDTASGIAFRDLAKRVVEQVEIRNQQQPPTQVVAMKN